MSQINKTFTRKNTKGQIIHFRKVLRSKQYRNDIAKRATKRRGFPANSLLCHNIQFDINASKYTFQRKFKRIAKKYKMLNKRVVDMYEASEEHANENCTEDDIFTIRGKDDNAELPKLIKWEAKKENDTYKMRARKYGVSRLILPSKRTGQRKTKLKTECYYMTKNEIQREINEEDSWEDHVKNLLHYDTIPDEDHNPFEGCFENSDDDESISKWEQNGSDSKNNIDIDQCDVPSKDNFILGAGNNTDNEHYEKFDLPDPNQVYQEDIELIDNSKQKKSKHTWYFFVENDFDQVPKEQIVPSGELSDGIHEENIIEEPKRIRNKKRNTKLKRGMDAFVASRNKKRKSLTH